MTHRLAPRLAAGLLAAACCLSIAPAAAQDVRAVTVARGLDSPWAVAFLPDGRMLVTEKPGRLRIVAKDGSLSAPLAGLPAVSAGGQCGLLDVVLDPQFASNRRIWFSFAEPAAGGERGNSTALGRAQLGTDDRLSDVRTVFSQRPKVSSQIHCGSRIVFDRQGRLYLGMGDRGSRKDDAQVLDNHIGKVVRLDAEGKAAADNPFAGRAGAAPELWSIGHRNIQGMTLNPATGELWASEHGPQGGDEVNIVGGGRNYGWPLVTYGRNYGSGTVIGDEGPKPGIEMPLRHWVPTSVAPSGLAFVTGDRYPEWRGHLLMGTLRTQQLLLLETDGKRITGEKRVLPNLNKRIRDVRQGPDGFVYLVTDGDGGEIIRLER